MKSKVYEKDKYKVVVHGTPDLSLIPKDKIDLLASVLETIICEMVKEDDLNDRTGSDKAWTQRYSLLLLEEKYVWRRV